MVFGASAEVVGAAAVVIGEEVVDVEVVDIEVVDVEAAGEVVVGDDGGGDVVVRRVVDVLNEVAVSPEQLATSRRATIVSRTAEPPSYRLATMSTSMR